MNEFLDHSSHLTRVGDHVLLLYRILLCFRLRTRGMSPTVLRIRAYRFFFNSAEETRRHIQDADVELDALEHPERFPLKYR